MLLAGSIACEVTGTLLLDASAGFTRPWATLGVLTGYAVSVLLFCRALDHGLALGVAYGTLTGVGLVSATVLGTVLLGQPLGVVQVLGLTSILLGALLLRRPAEVDGP